MIKSAHLSLMLAAALAFPAIVTAQDNSAPPAMPAAPAAPDNSAAPAAPAAPDNSAAAAMPAAPDNSASLAISEAVLRQANTLVLRDTLAKAAALVQHNDIVGAAKLYQDAVSLTQEIGPAGIEAETQQALAGLSSTSLSLARDAQSNGDYMEADTRVKVVLKADPNNAVAIDFKLRNDEMIAATKKNRPDALTTEQAPAILNEVTNAAILVQDGKFFYEMGKLDEADAKLMEAVKLDPDNTAAYYYQNLVKQARYTRDNNQHAVDTQTRMEQVEKQWVLPRSSANIPPIDNPYATNDLIYTGPGRQAIVSKLDRIHLDSINFDGVILSEVVRQLSELSRARDPDHKGINFLINPNPDESGPDIAAAAGGPGGGLGGGGAPAPAQQIDPATGLPVAGGAAGGTGDKVDIGTAVTVKLSLTDERLADVLDAIIDVAEHPDGHPIKYEVKDYGVVFSDKGPENPLLFTRTFKIDPNTFYSGLESVGSSTFGSSSSSGGGGGGGGGKGGGGGGSSSGSGQNNGAVVGVVNAFSGAGGLRSTGTGGGGGGGGGAGAINPLNAGGAGGGGGGAGGGGGLNYITTVTLSQTVSTAARTFFTTLGVNLTEPPGKAVFFNDKSGLLFVKATEQDLDTIDKAIQTLDMVPPQVHIKARFIEVSQDDSKAFGFDWYLGQFNVGNQVVGSGGSTPSLNVPISQANPYGAFPGDALANIIPPSANDQLLTSGLRNSGPAIASLTGILTNPNFQVTLQALQQRSGYEEMGEPEITTISGRQAQMRATQVITVIVDFNFTQGTGGVSTPTTQ